MNKLYDHLHNVNSNSKKQFLSICLLFCFTLYMGIHADAQCVPAPVVNAVTNQVVCNNAVTTAINFTGTATSYNWTNTITSIGLAASGTGNIATFTALNPSSVAVTAIITVTPVTGACSGTPISFTITVNPSPVVTVTPATSCGGVVNGSGPCNLLTASGNADTYTWSPLLGLFSNCTATAPYTGISVPAVYAAPTFNTIYTVTGTITAAGCSSTATAQVNYTPPAPVVTPASVFMCLSDPPVKLKIGTAPTTVQYCSGAVSIPVPDNDPVGVSNSILVSGIQPFCTISGISVTINMTHSRIGNMVFILKAPNGQIINLDYHLTATGGTGPTTGFVNTNISSTGIPALSAGTSPYTGVFKADAQLIPAGGFGAAGPTGMQPTSTSWTGLLSSPNGNWTLGFYDGVAGDVGTLTSWCLGITYSCTAGIPSTQAIWTPAAGLFFDPAATVPYVAGVAIDSVYTHPMPAGVYTYQVTTQGLPPALCNPATNFVSSNGNATITFNVKNNHPFPIRMTQIDSRTLVAGAAFTYAYYKASAISGLPGAISAANGWVQFGSASIIGTGTGVQPFMTGLNLVIPPGATFGICVQAITSAIVPNLSYSALSPGTYSFNDGGCEIITGSNIGFSGINIPAAPTVTPSGFVGTVHFSEATTNCTSPPRTVVVTVDLPTSITVQPANQNICIGQPATFTVIAAGSGTLIYQWQVSSNGGITYTNIINGGVYSGATTATLTIAVPTLGMSGYYYRVIVNGTSACTTVTSGVAILTVNPLPVILISANPYTILYPGWTTTISSTVSPNPAATYTWLHDGSVVPGATADTILVDFSGLGIYQLKVTDINGCTNVSDTISIRDSAHRSLFVYPNPSTGQFQARYYSEPNTSLPRTLIVYNNMGNRVVTKSYTQTISYQRIDLDLRMHGKGLYWIELVDVNGKRLALSRVMIQ